MLLACEYNGHCCFPIAAKNCLDYAEWKSDPIDEVYDWHINAATELLKLKLVEEKTESKEYNSEEFFKCLGSERMIIIQGKPGAGKTTFMRTICRDWEKGEIPDFSDKTLILVTLRDLKPDCSIKDILMQSCLDETCDYLNKCLTHHGEYFVFLLDGLDEYHGSPRKNDIEKILCTRDKLKNAKIIVTSRSSARLLKKIPCHTFQIDDINKEQVLQYFAKHEEVKKYLEENPNILQLCYVPLHCAMLKDIFNYNSDDRPKTETLFFKKHTEFRITRALSYIDEELKVPLVLDELMQGKDENATLLRSICEFAYNATEKSNNLAFDENSEFVKHFLDASKTTSAPKRKGMNRLGINSLGLLVIYPDTSKAKASRTNLYSFGHLTSQEFLAGCHIAYQLLQPKKSINAHLRNAWKFACGLLVKTEKLKEIFVSLKKAVFQTRQPDKDDLLFMIQCAHETQQKELCEVVYEYLEIIELYKVTPQDVSVFIKTIKQTSKLAWLKELR